MPRTSPAAYGVRELPLQPRAPADTGAQTSASPRESARKTPRLTLSSGSFCNRRSIFWPSVSGVSSSGSGGGGAAVLGGISPAERALMLGATSKRWRALLARLQRVQAFVRNDEMADVDKTPKAVCADQAGAAAGKWRDMRPAEYRKDRPRLAQRGSAGRSL